MLKSILRKPLPQTLLLCLSILILQGCSSTKSVPEGDALFTGFKVEVKGEKNKKQKASITTELGNTVRPKPNASILGLRPKLWIYNAVGPTKKEKGLKHFIKNKLGEAPVLLSQVDTNRVGGVMSSRLHNRGYFDNEVESATKVKKKMATITWTATVEPPYRLRNIKFPEDDSLKVNARIRETKAESLLKPGDIYNLQNMVLERERIDQQLKNKGYYYFGPDLLLFSVDTTVGNRQADVMLRVKKGSPVRALQSFNLEDIYIFANYSLADSLSTSDTIRYEKYYYIPNENYVKARHLLKGVFLVQDSLYSRQNHLLTTSRLMELGAYKYANIRYVPDTADQGKLDAFIYLTPSLKKSLRVEAQMVSKSNNFAGPGITASFRNRNAFKGSELLTLNLTGSFESQVGGRTTTSDTPEDKQTQNLTSYELTAQSTLTFPRVLAPFKVSNLRSEFAPNTRITAGYSFLNRVQFFQMNSYNLTYGYNWRPRRAITHEITPINVQYVRLGRVTPEFAKRLQENTFLQRSFENQFILGSMYQFTLNTQPFTERVHQFYNNFNIDVSGNLANAAQTLLGYEKPTDEAPRTIINQAYSQYTRLENDFRYYFNFNKQTQLATRLIAGVGKPYGNSSTLPYVKQFTIGGPNSIRAFRARSLGPGTYDVPDEQAFSYFDQTGDIKLEANIEYRFPITGFFRGALFVDAGNIWLLEDYTNPEGIIEKPGGKFNAGNLFSELAIGTGFGLRVDVEFFVIRFDFGIPVQNPSLPEGQRNVLGNFKPRLRGEDGMVLNIAIGYPF
ncbi:BamA/TamA family outer membrane protein [Pontibacter vulgaris]|uniref:translocation and assembly module lipoprotein TamL n=1 Tax=Pontibacter vulgaris TaxID=2905679 RepID=UPI001FA7DDE3|nr:BamA/TamA family outer membrane protein [Pontibacter vulgaris]